MKNPFHTRTVENPVSDSGDCSKVGFQIGDLVKAVPPFRLFSSSGEYDAVIIVGLKPLVAVSRFGDMLWSKTITEENLVKVGTADSRELMVAMRRYMADQRRKMI